MQIEDMASRQEPYGRIHGIVNPQFGLILPVKGDEREVRLCLGVEIRRVDYGDYEVWYDVI
jgi:hypothetical protein